MAPSQQTHMNLLIELLLILFPIWQKGKYNLTILSPL